MSDVKQLKQILRFLGFGGRKSRQVYKELYIITYQGDDLVAFYSLKEAKNFMTYVVKQYLTKGDPLKGVF